MMVNDDDWTQGWKNNNWKGREREIHLFRKNGEKLTKTTERKRRGLITSNLEETWSVNRAVTVNVVTSVDNTRLFNANTLPTLFSLPWIIFHKPNIISNHNRMTFTRFWNSLWKDSLLSIKYAIFHSIINDQHLSSRKDSLPTISSKNLNYHYVNQSRLNHLPLFFG